MTAVVAFADDQDGLPMQPPDLRAIAAAVTGASAPPDNSPALRELHVAVEHPAAGDELVAARGNWGFPCPTRK